MYMQEKKQQSGCERRGGEQHGQVGWELSQQGGGWGGQEGEFWAKWRLQLNEHTADVHPLPRTVQNFGNYVIEDGRVAFSDKEEDDEYDVRNLFYGLKGIIYLIFLSDTDNLVSIWDNLSSVAIII